MNEHDLINELADVSRDQHFLTSPGKLAVMVRAAEIRPTDRVLEVGAGIGTVARTLPRCASLTLVELDARLLPALRKNAPHATVIEGDALRLVREVPCDVLLSNLPGSVTPNLVDILPKIPFRTALITAAWHTSMESVRPHFQVESVTVIGGDDFTPAQAERSTVFRLRRVR